MNIYPKKKKKQFMNNNKTGPYNSCTFISCNNNAQKARRVGDEVNGLKTHKPYMYTTTSWLMDSEVNSFTQPSLFEMLVLVVSLFFFFFFNK